MDCANFWCKPLPQAIQRGQARLRKQSTSHVFVSLVPAALHPQKPCISDAGPRLVPCPGAGAGRPQSRCTG
jgi:hypothetical protein